MAVFAGGTANAKPAAQPEIEYMDSVRVGGRSYSDPDLVALIRASGGLADPRSLILTQARRLNQLYRRFESGGSTPFERLTQIASLRGLDVAPMNLERRSNEQRDAVVLLNGKAKGKQGQIFYNPERPAGRVNFSIAHEIVHTFVPPSAGGARFREMLDSDSREANELERLCDLGASEILMPLEDFRAAVRAWTIASVPELSQCFGSSFEATTFRLASAHPGIAAAGLLKFRLRKEEERRLLRLQSTATQEQLFSSPSSTGAADEPIPRYRRQSFHVSDSFPPTHYVHWNKSFDDESIVYRISASAGLSMAREQLPNGRRKTGLLEVLVAPFQRPDADSENPDLLFFWTAA